jgi:O-acetyl-ADP-ribose deacetylase (regulator of RNase III)
VPSHESLVADLRRLRERGLLRLRQLDLPALRVAAGPVAGGDGRDESHPAVQIEQFLRAAVDRLGDEETGTAARYLFGLFQGTIGRRPTDLRERAANVFGLSAETFRKGPEGLLLSRIADEMIMLMYGRDGRSRSDVVRDLALAGAGGSGGRYGTERFGPYPIRFGDHVVPITVHQGKVEHLRDIDVIVSSENTYLEPARMYTATLSGSLRRAAALRDDAGRVQRDVVRDELADWVARHGSTGNPFEPGLVVPTSPGSLVRQGIRRLYHAAVAEPRTGTNDYRVDGESIVRGIASVMRTLRAERASFDPPLRSFTLPLFGAGYGQVPPEDSFGRLWPALRAELAHEGEWEVHFTVLGADEAAAVLRGLAHEPAG